MEKSNRRQNNLRINHDDQVGDKVLITDKEIHRNLNCAAKGPYVIFQVYNINGAFIQHINIRRCTPYKDNETFRGEYRDSSSSTIANKRNLY